MFKYYIDDVETNEKDFNEKLDEAIENNVREKYDDLIDEDYPPIKIYGATYNVSRILKLIDPENYKVILDSYIDDAKGDTYNQIDTWGDVKIDDVRYEVITVEEDE